MKAFAPNGLPILGTLETVQCRADTDPNSFSRDANGDMDWEHEGSSEIFWDSIRTVRDERTEEALFLDEEGNEWRESELVLRGEEPADTAAVAKPISEAEMAEIARAWGKDLMSNLTRTKR